MDGGIDYVIKPCPFCGSEDLLIDVCTTKVRCKNCFATSGLVKKLVDDWQSRSGKDLAIAAWNRRSYKEGVENERRPEQ